MTEETEQAPRTGDTIAIAGEYQHRATHDSVFGAQRFWHQKRFDLCLELLDVTPGMRVLDAGCGSGVFADRIARAYAAEVVAIDANEAAVRFAREHYPRTNLEVRRGHVGALGLEPVSFDRIACLEVIEHIHLAQGRAMLETFAKLLKPGGKLLVSTPNAHSAWPAIEWLLDRLKLTAAMENEQHVIAYDARTLEALGASVGLALSTSCTLFMAAPFVANISWRRALARSRTSRSTRCRRAARTSLHAPGLSGV